MLFRSTWKLSRNIPVALTNSSALFEFISRAGAELSTTSKPTDLKSLVRVLSTVGTFKYPAFKPAIRRLIRNPDQVDWHPRLVDEAAGCSQTKALEYLKVLGEAEVPQDLIETLIKKVKISSPKELRDYISAMESLPSERLTSEVRNATTFVVKNAIINKMRLSTYLHIWHMIHHHWRSGQKHIIPTKLRSDLIQATWGSVPNLDLTKEADFVDCVKWLAMAEQPSLLPNKDEIASVLDKLEMQARRTLSKPLSPGSILTLLSHIISETRGDTLREPLDSIAQTLLKQILNLRKPQHQDNLASHIDLALAIERFVARGSTTPAANQIEQIIEPILPITIEVLERNLSQIPSRSLPVALRLISRVGGAADDEIARRGHEMDGTELVRLINSIPVSRDLLLSLFKTSLNDVDLLTDLVSSLSLSEKLEFLSTLVRTGVYHHDDLTILTEGLIEGIRSDTSNPATPISHETFSLDTLIKMCSSGDSDLIESLTNQSICPTQLLAEFLASERPAKELGIHQAIDLLAVNDCPSRSAIVDFVFASRDSLSANQCVHLLSVLDRSDSAYNEAMKLVVPKISSIQDINELMVHVSKVPSSDGAQKYSPSNQLRLALQDRIAQLVGTMDNNQIANCLTHMARLDLYSQESVGKLVSRLNELSSSGSHASYIIENLITLRVFDKGIMDSMIREYVRSSRVMDGSPSVSQLAAACARMGYKNKDLTDLCEERLRRGAIDDLSESISLIHSLAKNQVYSPLFQEKLRQVMDDCTKDISSVCESDWVKLYEINLALLVESPPRIKSKYMNDKAFKSFIDENCSYSWYAQQERRRSSFIHSSIRGELQTAIESLGWSMRVPEIGKEVYHVDMLSTGENDNRVSIVVVPESDELRRSATSSSVRIVVGDSMTKIRHLQMFGYTVVPVWESEWSVARTPEKQKELLLKYSNQVVYATGVSPK